jgi:hypothetical protein
MGWVMLIITICTIIFAMLLVRSNPKIALLLSALVPLTTFYYIGKNGYNETFIFSSILYFVVVNALIIRNNLKKV